MTQVSAEHYQDTYIHPTRFQLYCSIINSALKYECKSVLEIGIGQGIVAHTLSFLGKEVIGTDFDISLKPDVVANVNNLPFKRNTFDLIIASQIFEHVKYIDFEACLFPLSHITSRYLIISVPFNQHYLDIRVGFKINKYLKFKGRLNELLNRCFPMYLYYGISQSDTKLKFNGEHYWEIGYKNYSLNRIKHSIGKNFKILDDYRVELSPYHYIFILKTYDCK